jgi:transposase-like protein
MDVEEVLREEENSTAPSNRFECPAEESTLRRWRNEFPEQLRQIASKLETEAKTAALSLTSAKSGLQRCRDALASLGMVFSHDTCCLAWAFFVSKTHPVCVF